MPRYAKADGKDWLLLFFDDPFEDDFYFIAGFDQSKGNFRRRRLDAKVRHLHLSFALNTQSSFAVLHPVYRHGNALFDPGNRQVAFGIVAKRIAGFPFYIRRRHFCQDVGNLRVRLLLHSAVHYAVHCAFAASDGSNGYLDVHLGKVFQRGNRGCGKVGWKLAIHIHKPGDERAFDLPIVNGRRSFNLDATPSRDALIAHDQASTASTEGSGGRLSESG